MKTSSEPGARPALDRPTAWACTLTNALTLPGLGSLAAGRKVGYAQAGLALVGFGLTMYWLVKTVMEWLARGELRAEVSLTLMIGLGGVMVFAMAWLWAFATSLGLIREAKANEQTLRAQSEGDV